jgi:hypothetical protein
VSLLFSVEIKVIFIAEDFSGLDALHDFVSNQLIQSIVIERDTFRFAVNYGPVTWGGRKRMR